MCEFTVPGSYAGDTKHRKRGEKPCRECRDAANVKNREWQKTRSPRRIRAAHLWANYRLKIQEYEDLRASQGDACAICQELLPPEPNRSVHVDHRHDCEHADRGYYSCAICVRGILCQRCNTSLAILDDEEWLKQAMAYLAEDDRITELLRRSRLWQEDSGGL